MSEKQTENNIDEIFRKGIEPLQTEPSDVFWRKSAESIISNAKKADNKKASRWRVIAFFLGICLLTLGYFTIHMQSRSVSNTPTVAGLKNQETEKSGNPAGGNETALKPENVNTTQTAFGNAKIVNQLTSHKGRIKNRANGTNNTSNQVAIKKTGSPIVAATVNKHSHTAKQQAKKLIAGNVGDKKAGVSRETKTSEPEVSPNENVPQPPVQNTNSFLASNPLKANPSVSKNLSDTLIKIRSGDTLVTSTAPSKFSLSAYFSPDILTGYSFKSGNKEDENSVMAGEKENFSYSTGVNVAYELCPRFTLSAGLGYQSFSFTVSPSYLYAHKQTDGQIGYSMVTSSGIIDCPPYANATIGDSLKMGATSTRSYLVIPFELRYFALQTGRLNVFIKAGIGINISTGSQTEMNWQDYWQSTVTSNVSGVEGLQSIYYSYLIGVGANYNFTRRVGLYLEPTLQGSLTAINKNTPVVSYPYLIGLNAGVTYHL